jgi:hypothetical protein
MNKQEIIKQLKNQAAKIGQPGFDLHIWKQSTSAILKNALGKEHDFVKRIMLLEQVEKMSYEELYPKKIADKEKSSAKFQKTVDEIIEQIKVLEEADLEEGAGKNGSQTLKVVIESLSNNLTGNQLKALKVIGSKKKSKNQQQEMAEQIKQYNVDTMQQLLAEILVVKEIWEEV